MKKLLCTILSAISFLCIACIFAGCNLTGKIDGIWGGGASDDQLNIQYKYMPDGAENPNPSYIDDKNGIYQLKPIESTAAYTFIGWYSDDLCNSQITEIDPNLSCYYTGFVRIYAKFEYNSFTVNYYVDNELYNTQTFDFNTRTKLKTPTIPVKEHYSAHWSEEITDYKNYEINAVYDIDRFEIIVQTNVTGFEVAAEKYDYGTTYQTIYDKIAYNDKILDGLYYENTFETKVNTTDLMNKNATVYAKWLEEYHINTRDDWALLSAHPDGYIRLEADLDFTGETIPVVPNFSGVFDGNGHKLSNFINLNNSCTSVYGIFANNSGTIRNLTIDDGVFTAVTSEEVAYKSVGMLCGVNSGHIENIQIDNVAVKILIQHSTRPLGVNVSNYENSNCAAIIAANNSGTVTDCIIKENTNANLGISIYGRTTWNFNDNYIRAWAYFGLAVGTNSGQISNVTAGATLSTSGSVTLEKTDAYSNYHAYVYYPLQMGGIAGNNAESGKIENSLSNAKVNADFYLTARRKYFGILDIGGIAGFSQGQIINCRSGKECVLNAHANAETRMGGIVGTLEGNAVIKTSYSEAAFKIGNANTENEKTYLGGLAGINNAAITYSYAVISDVTINSFDGAKIDGYTNGYFGGMFGFGTDLSSVIHCFGVTDCDLAQLPLAYKSVQGATENGTVVKCFVFATVNAAGLNSTDELQATVCDSQESIIREIQKDNYENMGYTLSTDSYPVLDGIGYKVIGE